MGKRGKDDEETLFLPSHSEMPNTFLEKPEDLVRWLSKKETTTIYGDGLETIGSSSENAVTRIWAIVSHRKPSRASSRSRS